MLDELKFRYRNLQPWARFLIVCIIGVLPGVWTYLEAAPELEAAREAATAKESQARQKLAKAKELIKDLPQVEEKLRNTREQLKKAETLLPSEVYVDQVLQFVSQSANEADVSIVKFEPIGMKLIAGDYPYNEVRFKVATEGKYGRLGEWMDSVGGNQSRGFVKNWSIQRGKSKHLPQQASAVVAANGTDKPPASTASGDRGTKEEAQSARENLVLGMETEVVYYAAATEAQIATVNAESTAKAEAEKANEGAKDKNKAKDDSKDREKTNAKPQSGGAA